MARRKSNKDATRNWAIQTARIAHDDNAEDIVILDLRGVSPVTDYFVICTGTSGRQMRSVADEMARVGKTTGHTVWHVAGKDSPDWVVLDFVDVVVHLFERSRRSYYDLELIWGQVPHVEWRREPAGPADGDEAT